MKIERKTVGNMDKGDYSIWKRSVTDEFEFLLCLKGDLSLVYNNEEGMFIFDAIYEHSRTDHPCAKSFSWRRNED